jgi:hypothetical protein
MKSANPPVGGGFGFLAFCISKNISNPLFSWGVGDGDIVGADFCMAKNISSPLFSWGVGDGDIVGADDTVGVGDGVTEGGDDEIEIGDGVNFFACRRKTSWGFSLIKSKRVLTGSCPCTVDEATGLDEDGAMDKATGVDGDADMDETKGMDEDADEDENTGVGRPKYTTDGAADGYAGMTADCAAGDEADCAAGDEGFLGCKGRKRLSGDLLPAIPSI